MVLGNNTNGKPERKKESPSEQTNLFIKTNKQKRGWLRGLEIQNLNYTPLIYKFGTQSNITISAPKGFEHPFSVL